MDLVEAEREPIQRSSRKECSSASSSSSYNLRLGGAHGFLTDDPGSQRSVARVSKVVLAGQALDKQQQFTHREGSGRSAKKLSVALSVPTLAPRTSSL